MINLQHARFTLSAEADSFMHMGQRFQQHARSGRVGSILVLIGLLALVILAAWLLTRYIQYRDGSGSASPRALFAELCRAHRLDWTARRLLSQLARYHQLGSPARLFVELHFFRTDHVTGALRQRRTEIRSLRDKIFGASPCAEELPEDRCSKSPGERVENLP